MRRLAARRGLGLRRPAGSHGADGPFQPETGQLSDRPSRYDPIKVLTLAIESGTLDGGVIDWLHSCLSTERFDRGHGAHHHQLGDHEIHKEVESR